MTCASETRARGRALLAVDDNRLILKVIEDFFVAAGWSVRTVENVAAARGALTDAVPDVIVSDILMPDVDGWEFFESVRSNKATASVPFVFLTVERELPQRLRGLRLGADDYMTKPFAVEELEARIERLLERSAAGSPARAPVTEALLSGSVEHLAICDLLQILALNGKDGTVVLERGDASGRIEFTGGRIVDACAGSASGRKALFRMLSWAEATFRVVPRDAKFRPTIKSPTASVLMDGVVSLDDWVRWEKLLPDGGTRLVLAGNAQDLMRGRAVRPVEADLIARAEGGITVAAAIEESPHTDSQIAEALCGLLQSGVLRSVPSVSPAETAARR